MKKNMGSIDIAVRLLIAALVILLYFTNVISGTLAIIFLIVAIAFFIYNANERVDVNILHTRYLDVPLMVVLLIYKIS